MSIINLGSEQLIQVLKNNSDKILVGFKRRRDDIDKYIYLKTKFSSGCNIVNDVEFQNIYKTFYVMRRAGLTNEYFIKYFKLLNTRTFDNQNKLTDYLAKMNGILTHRGHNSIQFSFATKALHTTNHSLPIYDIHVGNFFQLRNPNDANQSIQNRIETRQRIYNELINRFRNLLSLNETKRYLESIRSALDITNVINDTKLLDFIIWIHGSTIDIAKNKARSLR